MSIREQGFPNLAFTLVLVLLGVHVACGIETAPPCVRTVPPDQPTNLAATAGDSSVTLTFAPPTGSGCVESYNITYMPLGPQGDKGRMVQLPSTKETNYTISGLDNGSPLFIMVESVNPSFKNKTKPAVITAMPQRDCAAAASEPLGPASNLTAYSNAVAVRLCWKQPTSGMCPSEYRVAHRLVPLTDEEVRTAGWKYQSVKTAGCMTIGNLQDRRTYQFAVQTVSSTTKGKQGPVVGSQATVTKDWRCMPVPNFYPICQAAFNGQCNPMSCSEQAKAGKCASSLLRQSDRSSKTIVQYCSDVCGCVMEEGYTPAAEPSVGKFDYSDSPQGCCRN